MTGMLAPSLLFDADLGWSKQDNDHGTIWQKGHATRSPAALLEGLTTDGAFDACADWLGSVSGNFAFVLQNRDVTVAMTDHVRSIPLLIGAQNAKIVIGQSGNVLRKTLGLAEIDEHAGLQIAMAGYTAGRETLYAGLEQLRAGEIACIDHRTGKVAFQRYYHYLPVAADDTAEDQTWQSRLADAIHDVFGDLAEELKDRPVFVPLSAGLDSRLVVSGLVENGHKNVTAYAYGRPGNFEAQASQKIADQMGIPWIFVPYSPSDIRRFSDSSDFHRYMEVSDTCGSLPFLQDFYAVSMLKTMNSVPEDAVFINGNSGDYISGGHIPDKLFQDAAGNGSADRAIQAQVTKHYSLWKDLHTAGNDAAIRDRLFASLHERFSSEELDTMDSRSLYEYLEFEARQTKFVISGQRVYEHLGHEWRLPLWHKIFLDFWQSVPWRLKRRQKLYVDTLADLNLGSVWQPMRHPEFVTPPWTRPMRFLGKCLTAPFGRDAWRRMDRQVFLYWTDVISTLAYRPYSRALFDRRGFRSGVALRCESYLQDHGLDHQGRPGRGPQTR
ncbi:asparagine synthetase B family protein [Hwanghaeella grinnelliae]|uniref:asparagine synthase (glutamine-hydrolyzing) n=1 Tax=Hwanghaeella grinnelliae TaxID=2500179 RepID=A0A3S2WSF8_9PROT|nr:asparagine synthase C-terminal domain-containing protein [Hwanghaeella grinnelliae]RVU36750.1 asparagine synthetase B family protein [Hwanghaeella grinnelliae]